MASEPAHAPGRLDLRVVARFLDALVAPDGTTRRLSRSRLQMAARVNYDIFRHYLEALQGRGLLATPDGDGLALTAAGLEFRARLRRLLAELLGPPAG